MDNDRTLINSNSEQTLRPGARLFNGVYRIDRVIGRGGFGITYLAYNENLEVAVAIKEFFPKGMYNRGFDSTSASVASQDNAVLADKLKAKFVKEAKRIARLRHDSIVGVSNTFEENGTAYYVMDLIEGCDLQALVKDKGPLTVERAVNYVTQVGRALEYLHSLRINHLDVKPANILVDNNTGRAVLIDFGLSKQYDNSGHQTSTTPVGISPGYAPMEQYKSGGVEDFSAPTDVYSLGATLYYLLTGQRPPEAMALGDEILVFPSTVPDYIQKAIIRAMKPQRAERYQTVAEFLSALINTHHSVTPPVLKPANIELRTGNEEFTEGKNLISQASTVVVVLLIIIITFLVCTFRTFR